MLLMIDNYDSFTYNLVQYLAELGQEAVVWRNDEFELAKVEALNPDYLVLSPGPCAPDQAGLSMDIVRTYSPRIPTLGVCLGHQCIAQAFGGKVVPAKAVMHGMTSMINHDGQSVFRNAPQPFEATRYHSLAVEKEMLPDCLEITAWTRDEAGKFEEIMGLRHKELPIVGVQFHPESIMTPCGKSLLKNFLQEYR